MVPAVNYEDVCRQVASSSYRDDRGNESPELTTKVTMVGLLFARPDAPLAKAEIIPGLKYFHHRSGEHINFYCAGFAEGWPGDHHGFTYVDADIRDWVFSDGKFNEFRQEIESMSRWKYSGETDLILTNAYYDRSRKSAYLDFRSAIVCHLEEMKNDGAINSSSSFFEDIFRYAEKADGNDPTWEFSDSRGLAVAGSALKRFILYLLPKDLGKEFKRLEHFAIEDISR
jgi:hypothetical protein